MVEAIETVIIGSGHAGLSTSYLLKQRGHEHVVLEKAAGPGDAWRSQRWDSFTFVTPNWSFRLPGGEYDGPEPDAFMTRAELVSRFEKYVEKNQLPVLYNSCVTAVQPLDDGGFVVKTLDKDYQARHVVAANGWFNTGKVPPFSAKIPPSILQIHTSGYRSERSLPPGAVLVGGSGQSGAQIAEELNQSGRKVFLATGVAPHAPRRYRGKDLFYWMVHSGLGDRTFEQARFMGHNFVGPLVSGKNGGHTLNLHQFHRDGITLLGHALDYVDGKLILAPDLKENLAKADGAQKFMMKMVDDYIERTGIDAPPEELPQPTDGYAAREITTLDLQAEGISTIIWGCGYQYDSSIFQLPVLNAYGLPDAQQGITNHPGLYFTGFPFQPTLKTGFVAGVSEVASIVTEKICGL